MYRVYDKEKNKYLEPEDFAIDGDGDLLIINRRLYTFERPRKPEKYLIKRRPDKKRYQSFAHWNKDECPVKWKYSEDYELLVDMKNNKVVCFLGEPEDRTFIRDLSELIDLLNKYDEAGNHGI